MSIPTVWVSCGVLRAELEELLRLGRIAGELLFLDSMLHMIPQELETKLTGTLEGLVSEDRPVVLVYGDCCPRMLDLAHQCRVGRVGAVNCTQMLVGHARYRELMRERAFTLLPEWAPRWQEVFQVELGLTQDTARDFMQDDHEALVYLDTGLVSAPWETLAGCSDYTGLPLRIERVSLNPLLDLLLEAEAAVRAAGEKSP